MLALAAGSSRAVWCGMEGGRFLCRKKNSHQERIQLKRPFGETSLLHVITSCSSYFYSLCSVICTGLTHLVTVSSAQMVLRDPLNALHHIGQLRVRNCGSCPCPRCVFTSKLLTVAFMLPLQQPNTRISTLVCQEVGH